MIISAYFFENFFDTIPYEQLFLDLQQTSIRIEKDLLNFSNCSFSIPLNTRINKGSKVVIYEENSLGNAKKIFSGYVFEKKPILDRANSIILVTCYDEKHYLNQRKLLSPIVFMNEPISKIGTKIISEYNSFGDGRSFEMDSDLITLSCATGDSYFDVINEICIATNKQRKVDNGKIYIKTIVGEDNTFGVGLQEAVYGTNEQNISTINVVDEGIDYNVIVIQGSTTLVYPSPLPRPIKGVMYQKVRDWDDLPSVAQKTLDEMSGGTINYQFTIEQNSLDVDIGDLIILRVEGFGEYDFTGSTTVIKKITEYTNGVRIENIEVGEKKTKRKTLGGIIQNIQTEINRINLT